MAIRSVVSFSLMALMSADFVNGYELKDHEAYLAKEGIIVDDGKQKMYCQDKDKKEDFTTKDGKTNLYQSLLNSEKIIKLAQDNKNNDFDTIIRANKGKA